MDNKTSVIEYEILGYKIKLREDEDKTSVSPQDVVDLVRQESNKIMDKSPSLSKGEVALLVALQMAQENLMKEKKYQEDLRVLKDKAGKALDLIEDVTPPTT